MPAFLQQGASSPAFQQSPPLEKFIQELRGVNDIPVAAPDPFPAPVTGVTHYSLSTEQFRDKLHPSLGPTTLWGYKPAVVADGSYAGGQRHLGGIIIAHHGEPVQITITNKLPLPHIIPVDTSSNFPDARRHQNMHVTHMHGGYTPWMSDGIPTGWYTPDGAYGPSIPLSIYRILNPDLQPGQAENYYTIHVSARMAWYHDHAHDLTRTNVYAGLVSAFFIRDDYEAGLRRRGLPDYLENGGNEIPIIVQDKIFVNPDTIGTDPTWPGPATRGSLWYAHYYDPERWPPTPPATTVSGPQGEPPDPSCVPEFFGDTMLVNGTVYPEVTVEPRRYRLRLLNACNARFLNPQLFVADPNNPDNITLDTNTLEPTNAPGPDFLVLGNEGGFLPRPYRTRSNIPLNITTNPDGSNNPASEWGGTLITSPAERWDILVDFKNFAGQQIILYNDAPAPFPGGDPRNDYFLDAPPETSAGPGSGQPTVTEPGFGPDTRQIMRFNVSQGPVTGKPDRKLRISPATDLTAGNDPLPLPLGDTALPAGVPVRRLILDEVTDGYGRLIQKIGTATAAVVKEGGIAFMAPATEVVNDGTTEVWQFMNLTADTHPIHFHLVNVQVISRQPFDAANYAGGAPHLTGSPRPPEAYENGWKDTVRMNPGEVTNILIPFTLPTVPFDVPNSPRTGGHEYVYHCHILEHEEHDMMRPMVIMAAPKPPPAVPVTG